LVSEKFAKAAGIQGLKEADVIETRADFDENIPRLFDVLHMYGTDYMNSKDIYDYFSGCRVRYVGWLTDSSCNVYFKSNRDAYDALRSHLTDEEVLAEDNLYPTEWFKALPFEKTEKSILVHLQIRFATIQDTKQLDSNHTRRNLWRARNNRRPRMRGSFDRVKGWRRPVPDYTQGPLEKSKLNPMKRKYLSEEGSSDRDIKNQQRRSRRTKPYHVPQSSEDKPTRRHRKGRNTNRRDRSRSHGGSDSEGLGYRNNKNRMNTHRKRNSRDLNDYVDEDQGFDNTKVDTEASEVQEVPRMKEL